MAAIISIFWQICLLKTGPDKLPSSNFLLGLVIVANALLSWSAFMVLQTIVPISSDAASQMSEAQLRALTDGWLLAVRVVVGLACTAAITWGLLSLMNHGQRTNQTLSALYGSDLVLTLLTTTVFFLSQAAPEMIRQLANLGMFFWTVAVFGFVLHRALEISMGFGIAAALFLITFTFIVSQVAVNP